LGSPLISGQVVTNLTFISGITAMATLSGVISYCYAT
jgi:hypothetical protein